MLLHIEVRQSCGSLCRMCFTAPDTLPSTLPDHALWGHTRGTTCSLDNWFWVSVASDSALSAALWTNFSLQWVKTDTTCRTRIVVWRCHLDWRSPSWLRRTTSRCCSSVNLHCKPEELETHLSKWGTQWDMRGTCLLALLCLPPTLPAVCGVIYSLLLDLLLSFPCLHSVPVALAVSVVGTASSPHCRYGCAMLCSLPAAVSVASRYPHCVVA